MKRLSFPVVLTLVSLAAGAQPALWDSPELFDQIGLTSAQIDQVRAVQSREDKVIREAGAELNVYKAQLERLLIDPNPDMRKVEKILQDSMEWKLKSEMAEIRRRVDARKIMGEDKWEQFLRALRASRARARNWNRPDQDRPQAQGTNKPPARR